VSTRAAGVGIGGRKNIQSGADLHLFAGGLVSSILYQWNTGCEELMRGFSFIQHYWCFHHPFGVSDDARLPIGRRDMDLRSYCDLEFGRDKHGNRLW
jgi:hypothetical protein